jgi:membrane associated rhomboid family serine protease
MHTSQGPDLKFRCPLWSGLLSGAIVSGPLSCLMFAPICILLAPRFRYPAWDTYITLCLVVTLGGTLIGGLGVLAYTVSVYRNGFSGYNFWGNYSMVLWEEITHVEPVKYIGSPYLKVFFEGSDDPIWLPLTLVEQNKFDAAVIEYAPELNPLRRALLGNFTPSVSKNESQTSPISSVKGFKNLIEILTQAAQDRQTSIKLFLHLIVHPQQLIKLIHNHYFKKQESLYPQPWIQPTVFPAVPMPNTFGYQKRQHFYECSQLELRERLEQDPLGVELVWTPDSTNLQPPEEVPFLYEVVQSGKLNILKQQVGQYLLVTVIFGFLILGDIISAVKIGKWDFGNQFRLILFISVGIIPLLQTAWSIRQLQVMKPENKSKWTHEINFLSWIEIQKTPWTELLLGCIILVGIVQSIMGIQAISNPAFSPIFTVGIVKPDVWSGESWRLLTGTLIHGNVVHFFFNFFALREFAKLIEVLTHSFYVPIVFMLSALVGSLLSLAMLPDATSVGSSGGILGLLGFLCILMLKQRKYFPLAIVQMLFVDVIYIAVMGLVGYQFIDNAAHFGGFMTGMLLAILLLPSGKYLIPAVPSVWVKILAAITTVLLFGTTVFSVLKMLVF